ncbi:hypothetical protein MG296_08285 [Flavobacteriaceae bacterium TK19130]|nr:hypothetical protein [Thermobacterium salinum]
MKKFLTFTLFFLALLGFGYLMVAVFVNDGSRERNTYLGALEQKHFRIEQLNEPTIFIAGGSNVAFGTDSRQLEEIYSMPVVNLGIHYGLGVSFITNELKAVVEKGDVVFISLEYLLSGEGDYRVKRQASIIYPEASTYFEADFTKEVRSGLKRTRNNLQYVIDHHLKGIAESGYPKDSFNTYGDIVSTFNNEHHEQLKGKEELQYRDWEGVEILNEFYAFAQRKGVCVYFLYPPYPLSEFQKNETVILKTANYINARLKMDILNRPETFVYADSLFFDMVYHLNATGREKRMKALLEIITTKDEIGRCLQAKSELAHSISAVRNLK